MGALETVQTMQLSDNRASMSLKERNGSRCFVKNGYVHWFCFPFNFFSRIVSYAMIPLLLIADFITSCFNLLWSILESWIQHSMFRICNHSGAERELVLWCNDQLLISVLIYCQVLYVWTIWSDFDKISSLGFQNGEAKAQGKPIQNNSVLRPAPLSLTCKQVICYL